MIQSFRITSASVSDRGLNEKRPHNEDAFLEIPQSGIFAVADGVGGAEAGEVASQMAMEILGEAFINHDERTDAEEVMQKALKQANSAINKMSMELPQLAQMATTVVALHIAGNIATIGHAGDSRLYSLDSEGTLRRETADHSMVAEEVRAGRMTEEQAENHPGKNIISRALGAEPTIEIELKTIMVGENTTFMICSDGVTRHISDPEIGALLRSGRDLHAICQRIKAICFDRGAQDNLTAVLIRLDAADQALGYDVPASGSTETDEITVASARPQAAPVLREDADDDDLLELDTGELTLPASLRIDQEVPAAELPPVPDTIPVFRHEPEPIVATPTALAAVPEPENETHPENWFKEETPAVATYDIFAAAHDGSPETAEADEYETIPVISIEKPEPQNAVAQPEPDSPPQREAEFEMFGNNGQDEPDHKGRQRRSVLGRIVRSVGLLLVGGAVGLAVYHFILVDRLNVTFPQLVEMKSNNQPQTGFEENRRTLDKDPAAALARFETEPKDAENRFLVGRANLLLGRYPDARKAFQESRDRIAAGEVDPGNAKTIQTEIAIAMTVTNDPAVQAILKKEIEDLKAQSNVPVKNTNSALNQAGSNTNSANAAANSSKPTNSNARPPI